MRFAVLMTCFNRKEKTINCLNNLFNCFFGVPHDFDVYLVDDASTDGTVAAVRSKFPSVNIINGSGDLYWNKGMFLALIEGSDADYHVNSRIFGTGEDGNSERQMPILDAIYMKTADNKLVPWLASQTDVLAEDWQIVE